MSFGWFFALDLDEMLPLILLPLIIMGLIVLISDNVQRKKNGESAQVGLSVAVLVMVTVYTAFVCLFSDFYSIFEFLLFVGVPIILSIVASVIYYSFCIKKKIDANKYMWIFNILVVVICICSPYLIEWGYNCWCASMSIGKTTIDDLKPVIYLYPEEEQQVNIILDYDGDLTVTYPEYRDGWSVTARPDGTIVDADGREYYCLFWEGNYEGMYDMSEGFVVAGCDTAAFLEDALFKLGLNEKEANEFIIYWLPQMQNNAYNLISFQTDAYTDHAALDIQPKPDSIQRVFMAWKALDESIDIPEQELTGFEREGFTVVEWGGCKIG